MKRLPAYINDLEAWKASFHFFQPVKVRFSETDAFGHVNNTKVFVYFEEGRIALFEKIGIMKEWAARDSDAMIVTADLHCDYIRQITFGEALQVGVKVEKLGHSSMELHYLVVNEQEEICLTGRGTMVQVNKKTERSLPWNEKMKALFQPYLT
ncbi:acyl-CoA thioesterase [Alkalihalobacillus oceani]|uniref:acyl-CoA thioesterase n=1 Tax=Halalkalibacter oceani TaxID=1653776 RepID=UPI00203FA80C|nr:thioesterase family protein [Halalkalibacter oceani]MCM3759721.1 acyl-CoA thioesterase [Halalkalibacter oceani]